MTRSWDKLGFHNYSFDKLQPGDCYCFRMRFLNHKAWSGYSHPTKIYQTLAAPPTTPSSPICGFVACTTIQVRVYTLYTPILKILIYIHLHIYSYTHTHIHTYTYTTSSSGCPQLATTAPPSSSTECVARALEGIWCNYIEAQACRLWPQICILSSLIRSRWQLSTARGSQST